MQTGTLFLIDLRRRARADNRLHIVETAAVAALAGGLSNISITEWGQISFGDTQAGLLTALIAAAVWVAIGGLLYKLLEDSFRRYILSLLLETGLLYLVLEHDPHTALAPLRRREILTKLKLNPQAELSFRGRMLVFLRTYAGCAGVLGFHAYPSHLRWLSRVGDYLLFLLGALFIWLVYTNILNALHLQTGISAGLKLTTWALLLLILTRATLGVARKTGLWLALVEALLGDSHDTGRAILTGR